MFLLINEHSTIYQKVLLKKKEKKLNLNLLKPLSLISLSEIKWTEGHVK